MTLPNTDKSQLLIVPGDAYSQLTMTRLNNRNVVSDVFERGKQSHANQNYDEAIDSFTTAVEILEGDLSIALMHRAAVFEMLQDYESVMQDALRANPTNAVAVPDPYLTMANALLLQDRLREAALQLHIGITVVPASCTQHSSLVHLYQKVAAELDRRNRWIVDLLPKQVLNCILTLLPVRDCIRLSLTCRGWNSYIMREWPGMWTVIDTYKYKGDLPVNCDETIIQNALRAIPPFRAQSVVLDYDGLFDTKQADIIESFMLQHSWNKIEYLGIHGPRKSCCNVLQLNRNSIKALELWDSTIYSQKIYTENLLCDALTICTNLQAVTMHRTYQDDRAVFPNLHPSKLTLTRLSIFLSDTYGWYHSKSRLKINTDTLCIINARYPLIQELVLDIQPHVQDTTISYSSTPLLSGLNTLNLAVDGFAKPSDEDTDTRTTFHKQAHLLVQRNRIYLQSLTLSFLKVYSVEDCKLLLQIADTGLPTLTDLSLSFNSNCSDFTPRNFQDLIAGCPALERAKIHGGYIWDTGVFNELSKLVSLQELDIDMDRCSDIDCVTTEKGNGIANLLKNSQALRCFSFGYRCYDRYYNENCKSPNAHRKLLSEVTRCASNSKVQEFDISKVPIHLEEELISMLNYVRESQIRMFMVHTSYYIYADDVFQAFGSLKGVSFLKVYDPQSHLGTKELIRILNKHESESGIFTAQIMNRYGGYFGQKKGKESVENHLEAHSTKSQEYYEALYGIKYASTKHEYFSRPESFLHDENECEG